MMRFLPIAAVALLGLLAPACKHKDNLTTEEEKKTAPDIPRDIALGNLKTLLPSCVEVTCTLPRETLKSTEIREWVVANDGVQIVPTKAKPLAVNYADINNTALLKVGKQVHVRLYTTVQKDPNKEHFAFIFNSEEQGRNAVTYFESLRKKPQ